MTLRLDPTQKLCLQDRAVLDEGFEKGPPTSFPSIMKRHPPLLLFGATPSPLAEGKVL
jgi:hypothetical protein